MDLRKFYICIISKYVNVFLIGISKTFNIAGRLTIMLTNWTI